MNRGSENLDHGIPIGIILVHGYLGQPADLSSLESCLFARYGKQSVENICLPGHGSGQLPPFDESAFLSVLSAAIDQQHAQGHRLVLLGHSTGGSLLLAEISRRLTTDTASLEALQLLVLCATPPVIDLAYAQRWADHTAGQKTTLHDMGALVALVNRLARRAPLSISAPVLVLHGDADELVPVMATDSWRSRLPTAQRSVRIARAKHHLFSGENAEIAIDAVIRAIDDATHRGLTDYAESHQRNLFDIMPGLEGFCSTWPDSSWHIQNSPAARQILRENFKPGITANAEPTIANIEITTRCNLGCRACARTQLKPKSQFMSRDDFIRVLAHLPHAYRVVLVGLGEPLMHSDVIDFIKLAVSAGRRVSLVTNGMLLDAEMAQALCESGLAAITFSIDAVHQSTADLVRTGSDMQRIGTNIRALVAARKRLKNKLGISVFTALTCDTLGEFETIINFTADHELDAIMVSDLNFPANQENSVNHSFSAGQARIFRKAIKRAVARRLPVLSVSGLEAFALDKHYMDFLLLRGEQLAQRATRRSHCLSPWQSVPVNVNGDLTVCDCQPNAIIGNIHNTPVTAWWNGHAMLEHRRRMLGDDPPVACQSCPRF